LDETNFNFTSFLTDEVTMVATRLY